MDAYLDNYVRTHRKKAGLSQRDLGKLLGHPNQSAVSRHERSQSMPSLAVALGYAVVFGTSVAEIFAGLRESVEQAIEGRIAEFEEVLQQGSGKGPQAAAIAHKLEWLTERRISDR